MGRGDLHEEAVIPLRALPRLFVPGASLAAPIELPKDEVDKFRRVLRLAAGAEIAILPNDGTVIRCRFEGSSGAVPLAQETLDTESELRLTVAQALPKGDKLDEIVRACTELGVAEFVFFVAERTVVKWETAKLEHKLARLATIAREACEVSYRTRLPKFSFRNHLQDVLQPDSLVLSEVEGVTRTLPILPEGNASIVIGPEGGWAPREVALIGDRGITLGPRVLRVEHAAPAAAAKLLLA